MADESHEVMEITPLGAGCEVGRSCCIVKYAGATIMFDCGVHPAYNGLASLPYFDVIETSKIDLLLITHFHMDHCGALPFFTEKTNFRGRVFMTHPTKAIYRILMQDAVKMGNESDRLWDEKDLMASLEKIELINYHQTVQHKGVKFSCYNAGHVLGAAMFNVEVAGVRVLYTGDFSREEDRHLLGAENPTEPPHVLIVESTYGVSLHQPREVREQRFTQFIHQVVARGGRCLIPVFALGRSQELLLILEEYWRAHPELQEVPIYYASKVAKKSMRVYQTYINMMNHHIRDAHALGANPWNFQFVKNLEIGRGSLAHFDDSLPMVVMASPGMMQSGFSRELFEMWCSDRRNGLMMPGYSVAGTLAHHVMSEPKEIVTSAGDRVPVNLSIDYTSFSAHSDFQQTREFVASLRPAHVVLVHGAEEEMLRLQKELAKLYKPKQTDFYTPKNCQSVHLRFHGESVAKVVGSLAVEAPADGAELRGLLLKRDFKYTLMAPQDLKDGTRLACSAITHRPSFVYTGPLAPLLRAISRLFTVSTAAADASGGGAGVWRVHDEVVMSVEAELGSITLEWPAGPVNDMVADAVASNIMQLQTKHARGLLQNLPEASCTSGASEVAGEGQPAAGGEEAAPARVVEDVPGQTGPTLQDKEEEAASPSALAAAVHAALRDSFGEVVVMNGDGEATPRWELTACGAAVVLHGSGPLFDSVETAEAKARERVEKIVNRVQRSVLPLQ